MNLLSSIEVLVTGALVGLIWIVQLVHYPLFSYLDPARFNAAMAFHQNAITPVVVPLMIVELGLALLRTYSERTPAAAVGFLLVLLVWGQTFFIQVPLHQRLLAGGDTAATVSALVRSNWGRTLTWTLRSLWLFFIK
jgi:hypothetical protein